MEIAGLGKFLSPDLWDRHVHGADSMTLRPDGEAPANFFAPNFLKTGSREWVACSTFRNRCGS